MLWLQLAWSTYHPVAVKGSVIFVGVYKTHAKLIIVVDVDACAASERAL